MASLNAGAPEFISVTSVLPYNYYPLPNLPYHATCFYPSNYYTPCFTNFPIMESQVSVSTYCNADVFSASPSQWQLSLPPTSIVRALPNFDQSTEVEKNVVSEKIIERGSTTSKGSKARCLPRRWSRKQEIDQVFKTNMKVWKRIEGISGEKSCGGKIEARKEEIEAIQHGGTRTTVMIRNIPNKYTRGMLLELLDKHCMEENQKAQLVKPTIEEGNCLSAFDFLYLPIDFGSKCNKGYAFVNFTNPNAAWKLHLSFHDYEWKVLNSKKICKISYARIQGKEALIRHFERSNFSCETDEFLPAYFSPHRDGSGLSVEQYTVGRRLTPFRTTRNH